MIEDCGRLEREATVEFGHLGPERWDEGLQDFQFAVFEFCNLVEDEYPLHLALKRGKDADVAVIEALIAAVKATTTTLDTMTDAALSRRYDECGHSMYG